MLFDLDGVLYAGPAAVPGAVEAVTALKEREIPCAFVTNNASRSAETVAAHLSELGIPARTGEVYGSAPAGVRLMAEHVPSGSRVLVTGSSYLRQLVEEAGFIPVSSAAEGPAAVIQGFDPQLAGRIWLRPPTPSMTEQPGSRRIWTSASRGERGSHPATAPSPRRSPMPPDGGPQLPANQSRCSSLRQRPV